MLTYQDLQAAADKPSFILRAIQEHKSSTMYRIAYDAELYDRQLNPTIMNYRKLLYTVSGRAVPDNYSANYKLASNYFNRFITQENQYLLGNGVTLGSKEKLGKNFDIKLQQLGRNALVGGVGFGFWNLDHLEVFKLIEFVPLYDENNGSLKAGIRFWQIDYDKPLRATLYEEDGYTEYIQRKSEKVSVLAEKRSYKQTIRKSVIDGTQIFNGGNYPGFPIIPLWGNPHHQSELVGLRENIDAYDLIKSGFANDLDDVKQIYWIMKNTGGMDDVDISQFLDRVRSTRAAVLPDGDDGATAEPHTIEVPYQSRTAYLEKLEQDMYNDFQILNTTALSAAAKTATEINAAYTPMELKTDQYEYCVREFLDSLFLVVGITDEPEFKRSKITNQLEQTQMVLMAAQYLDDETLLNKLPWLTPEEVQDVLERRDAVDAERLGVVTGGQSAPANGQNSGTAGEENLEDVPAGS